MKLLAPKLPGVKSVSWIARGSILAAGEAPPEKLIPMYRQVYRLPRSFRRMVVTTIDSDVGWEAEDLRHYRERMRPQL